jgi:hypothetical protein
MTNTIKKNQLADIPTKNGNSYSYQYVDIAQIHEYLESINSKYIQQIQRIDGDDYIMTRRCFDNKWEDEWLQGCRVVDATLFGNDNPAQKQGSALTYARRYSLLMAYGQATEDDDANSLNNIKVLTKEEAESFAESYVFKNGKHANMTLKQIIDNNDTSFIEWLIAKSNDKKVLKAIELLTGKKELSQEEQIERIDLIKRIMDLTIEKDIDIEEICEKFGINELRDLTTEQMKKCIKAMEEKINE